MSPSARQKLIRLLMKEYLALRPWATWFNLSDAVDIGFKNIRAASRYEINYFSSR
jgi:hypothetical protein